MTDNELKNLLEALKYIPDEDKRDEATQLMLKSASESITLERLKKITGFDSRGQDNEEVFWRFSAKELSLMPKTFRKEFRTQGCTAHVRKRRSGKNSWNYEIRYRRNGYNITASANNLDQAKHKFIEMLGSAEKCVKNKERTIPSTFDKFANYFFEKFYKRKVGQSTFRVAMSNYKNHVVPHFGDMPLKSITADRCQELLDRLIDEDKVRTEENVFTMLNMIFKAAVKHGVMAHNPIDMVFHTKHEREHGKALTKDEERKLLEQTAGTPYQLMFAIGLYTGLRPNEYKTAVIDGDFIVANNSKRKNGKVESKKIPITPMLAPYLEGVNELHFTRLEQIRHKFNGILPDHKLYDLRTTFYTRCMECGVAEVATKTFVGHALGGMADTYTDLSDEFLYTEGQKLKY
mgnify:CR=1 FL=1